MKRFVFLRRKKGQDLVEENVEVIADDDDSLNSEALHAKSVLNLEKSGKNVKGSDRGYRCSLLPMIEVITDIKTSITSEHLQEMRCTPFFHLFNMFYEGKIEKKDATKSTKTLLKLISIYDKVTNAFVIGGVHLKLMVDDVCLIFGFKKNGKLIMPLYPKGYSEVETRYVRTHFKDHTLLHKNAIIDRLKEVVKKKDKDSTQDFARLVVLLIATTILFPNACYSLLWAFVPLVEELDEMGKISWAHAVHYHLMASIKKHLNKPTSVSSCVLLLGYWFCEHVNVIEQLLGYEKGFLRAAKWSFLKLNDYMDNKSIDNVESSK
ncbi:hypothetical protein FRX31_007582, partial [Thalictrum thalictroides]